MAEDSCGPYNYDVVKTQIRLMSYEVLEQLRRQLMLFKSPILDHPKTLILFIPDML